MNFFNITRFGRALSLTAAAVVGTAVFAAASAQTDSASVPFLVNVSATVSAASGAVEKQISVTGGAEAVLRLPILTSTGVRNGAQRINAPAVVSGFGGKVTVNLPAQSYKNAEVLLYTVGGKRLLRYNASAASAVNSVTRPNLATGVYLLSVKGAEGGIAASRLKHDGGALNISVAFGGEGAPSGKRSAKSAAVGDWTITVSADGYVDSVYTLHPTAGMNARQDITLRALAPALGVPADVAATIASANSITVTWSAVAGATGYRVYRSTDASGAYIQAGNVTTASFTNTGLSTGATYYYKVSAYNGGGESSQSSYASAALVVPGVPANMAATDVPGGMKISWSADPGATGYRIYSKTPLSDDYSLMVDELMTTSYTIMVNFVEITTYYKVSAYNIVGEGPMSEYVLWIPPLEVPPAPLNVYATARSRTSITVQWTLDGRADGYYVYRSNASNGVYTRVWVCSNAVCPNGSYINEGLTEGMNYYYKVSAYNDAGESPQSAYAYTTARVLIGTFTDSRDGKTYKSVEIDGKRWMAENLNFATASDSWCYKDSTKYCDTYGRLYSWDMAKTACPTGWHLPSRREWGDLAIFAGGVGEYGGGEDVPGQNKAGTNLRSKSGWNVSGGRDEFGFSGLPGGIRDGADASGKAKYFSIGYTGSWWTATSSGSSATTRVMMGQYDRLAEEGISTYGGIDAFARSVRCVKN